IHDNNDYIPYQLYKDSNYSTVWDATGGVTNVGGSGGVSKTGTLPTLLSKGTFAPRMPL
ncbi:spore coat protein U domain-containing protein, partial [Acinetobacter baumannii]|nr:spore coat protein U domain-containing protein [Acinetobacter baumannii]